MQGRWRGLRVQIFLWTVLPLTLALIGVAYTGVYSHEQAMRVLVSERDQAMSIVAAAEIAAALQIRETALQSIVERTARDGGNIVAAQRALADAAWSGNLFSAPLLLVDAAGNDLASRSGAANTLITDRAYVQSILEQRETVVATPADGGDTVLLGIPVEDVAGIPFAALIGPVSLRSLDLQELWNRAPLGEHAVIYLIDSQARILASSPSEPNVESTLDGHSGVAQCLADPAPGATLCQAPDGQRMTLAYAPVEYAHSGWRVVIQQPWEHVIGPVLRYSQFVPLVVLLAALVSLLALYYGVQSIARPLQALNARAERVAHGDYTPSEPVGGVQEIEELRLTLDHMAQRVQSYQTAIHHYIGAMTQGQEEERSRLARELHDDTTQALIALGQQVEMAQRTLAGDPERAALRLGQIRTMIAETLDGLRRLTRNLRPIYLEDLGFVPALQMLAERAEQQSGLRVELSVTGAPRRLASEIEMAAYRIVQEGLSNAIQHARATQVRVGVAFEPDRLVLRVCDNGTGFDASPPLDQWVSAGHLGLMGIRERSALYGGELTIRSAPGQGTEMTVELPLSTR